MASLLSLFCFTTLITSSFAQTCRRVSFDADPDCAGDHVFRCLFSEKDTAEEYCSSLLAPASPDAVTTFVTSTATETSVITAEVTSISTVIADTTAYNVTATLVHSFTNTTVLTVPTTQTVTNTITDTTIVTTTVGATVTSPVPAKSNIAKRSLFGGDKIGCLQSDAPSNEQITSACSCLVTSVAPSEAPTTTLTTTLTTTALVTTSPVVNGTVSSTRTTFETTTVTTSVTTTLTLTATTTLSESTATTVTATSTKVQSAVVTDLSYRRPNVRIEGADWAIYEGHIEADERSLSTSSGGAHVCDGTNNGAHPTPGETGSTRAASAAKEVGAVFDGTWSTQFQDYFITQIGDSQTGSKFWGILRDYAYTPTGGCQEQFGPDENLLWAYDAFNKNVFLRASFVGDTFTGSQPNTIVKNINVGESVQMSIDGMNPNNGASSAGANAAIVDKAGVVYGSSDANGRVTVVFSSPGVYKLKASRSGALRSNALVVNVRPS